MLRLEQLINEYNKDRVYHIKRGFCISDVTLETITCHLLEEAVELQAECILGGTIPQVRKEAADVLIIFLHLLHKCNISFVEVEKEAEVKLSETFTNDMANITAKTPGLTRKSR